MLNHAKRIKELEAQTSELYDLVLSLIKSNRQANRALSAKHKNRSTHAVSLMFSAISMLVCKFLYASEDEITDETWRRGVKHFWGKAELFRAKGVLESAYDQNGPGDRDAD